MDENLEKGFGDEYAPNELARALKDIELRLISELIGVVVLVGWAKF